MPKTSKFVNPFKGNKARLFEICYYGVLHAEEKKINKAIYRNINTEETCDIRQSISQIRIDNSSISTSLTINERLCTDLDKI